MNRLTPLLFLVCITKALLVHADDALPKTIMTTRGKLLVSENFIKPPAGPPSLRLKLTPAQSDTKRAALMDHQAGTSPIHDGLVEEYLKPEEHFWQIPIP